VVGDLGCGTGVVSEWIAPFAERVIAVDTSSEMLDAARGRLSGLKHVAVRAGSLEKLPVTVGELVVVLAMLVLHHVPEPRRALTEAARALKSGGRILILDMMPHDREEYRQTMGHVWLGFGEKQLSQWLAVSGFHELRYRPLAPEPKTKGPSLFVATARRI
jgi:ArsR family transcriptional regulator